MFELEKPKNPIEKILRSDISKEMPKIGETEIIMQRHEDYIRDTENKNVGSLEEKDAQVAYEQTVEILENKLKNISESEYNTVNILVIASCTKYIKGMRSFETAEQVLRGIRDVFIKNNIKEKQILNSRKKENQPVKIKSIQEPKFLNESPEFLEFLKEKYGDKTQEFWQAFEEDWEKETREKNKAEGPDDIIYRYSKFMKVLINFSEIYHEKNQGCRLIIWPVSHYDTISPFTKRKVLNEDSNTYLPVDYGAGISLIINKDGEIISNIRNQKFSVNLE